MDKGIGGHQRGFEGRTNDWLTPPEIIDALGPFMLDPCASVDQPWRTAKVHYTTEGLERKWYGRVWLNPPYGPHVYQWVKRLAEHGNGIALTFARIETVGFFRGVWNKASALLFLKGRLNFYLPVTGERSNNNAGGPSVLIAYGEENVEKLRESKLEGVLVEDWEVLNG